MMMGIGDDYNSQVNLKVIINMIEKSEGEERRTRLGNGEQTVSVKTGKKQYGFIGNSREKTVKGSV